MLLGYHAPLQLQRRRQVALLLAEVLLEQGVLLHVLGPTGGLAVGRL